MIFIIIKYIFLGKKIFHISKIAKNAIEKIIDQKICILSRIINTSAKGANALCPTNKGKVNISGTKITLTGSGSARGLYSTYRGTMIGSNLEISTAEGSCATLATDRGEGKVTCIECSLSTA